MIDIWTAGIFSQQSAFLIAVALAAGLARGFSGFGAALIFVPVASSLIGPQVAVPLLLVVDGVMTVGLVPGAVRREVVTMTVGAAVGVPLGVYLLTNLNPLTIRWSIVVLAGIMLALLVSGWRYHGRPRAPLTVLVGLVAGLFSGVAQVGGPPVVAYWLGGSASRGVVRANLVLYFAASTVLTAAGYIWGGLITAQVLILTLITAPLYGVGVWLGSKMFGKASEITFRRICYLMIAIAATASIPALDGVLR